VAGDTIEQKAPYLSRDKELFLMQAGRSDPLGQPAKHHFRLFLELVYRQFRVAGYAEYRKFSGR
jgi:hypothetical protein